MNFFKKDHVYIIAEAGVNHNGSYDLALELIDAAAEAGADAVKFQTFDAEKLAGAKAPKADYQKRTTDKHESQLDMLRRLELPRDWHWPLKVHAAARGIDFISTAFDADSLAFLVELDIPFFKIPSGELTNAPLLWQFARSGKPLVLSTGMATLSEVEEGLAVIVHALCSQQEPNEVSDVWKAWSDAANRNCLKDRVILLHCTSRYPTPLDETNMRAMGTLRDAFGLDVGYSDHTEGGLVPVVAAARGARVIEKHFTMDRNLPGPDHPASLEPGELTRLVADIRAVERCLGSEAKAPMPGEWDTRQAARQQVIAARDLPQGHVLSRSDLSTARVGSGLPPSAIWGLIGQQTDRAFSAGEALE